MTTFPRRTFIPDANAIDAKALRTSYGVVESFKRRHDLPRDQRLSDAAQALLRQELETAATAAKGEGIAREQALALITERATPEALQLLAAVVPCASAISRATWERKVWISSSQLENYLLNRVEALTGKRYQNAGAAWRRAATIAPAAAAAAEALKGDGTEARERLILFWGVVLRLDSLEGPPPADPAAFYGWCQLDAYHRHAPDPLGDVIDALSGRMGTTEARSLLALPITGPLAPAAIRAAFRSQASDHHPDAGGSRVRFERLTEARDRLLLEVQA